MPRQMRIKNFAIRPRVNLADIENDFKLLKKQIISKFHEAYIDMFRPKEWFGKN